MKRIIKTYSIAVALTALAFVLTPGAQAQNSGLNPSSVQIKSLQVMISTNANCSNPISVGAANASASYVEMTTGPTLFSGSVSSGTYNCLMMNMSNLVKLTPATTSTDGICQAGTQYTLNICYNGLGGASYTTPTGVTGTCTATSQVDPTETPIWTYMSTTGSTSNEGFSPSLASPLGSSLVVNKNQTITFTVDFNGTVRSDGTNCVTSAPTISF